MQMNIFVNGGNYYIVERFPEVKIFLHHQIPNGKLAYEFRKDGFALEDQIVQKSVGFFIGERDLPPVDGNGGRTEQFCV